MIRVIPEDVCIVSPFPIFFIVPTVVTTPRTCSSSISCRKLSMFHLKPTVFFPITVRRIPADKVFVSTLPASSPIPTVHVGRCSSRRRPERNVFGVKSPYSIFFTITMLRPKFMNCLATVYFNVTVPIVVVTIFIRRDESSGKGRNQKKQKCAPRRS